MNIWKDIAILSVGYVAGRNYIYVPRRSNSNYYRGNYPSRYNNDLSLAETLKAALTKVITKKMNKVFNLDSTELDQVYFSNYEDAKTVLHELKELVMNYGFCSFKDFYYASGTAYKNDAKSSMYGWDDLSSVKILCANGNKKMYYLDFPKAKYRYNR